MAELMFFDAFVEVGPRSHKHPAHAWRLDQVLAEMEHCSISGALVASTMSVSYDLMHGNLALCAALQPYDHLFPVWNAMPHQTGEFPAPDELGKLMAEHDVRAVTVHPAANGWDWQADHSQVLFRWLESQQVLTIVKNGQLGNYRDLDAFLTRYPQLPVLLMGAGWGEQRLLLPLLAKHRGLHVGFSHLQAHYLLEYLYQEGHEDQLVFASNAPQMSMGAHRTYIDYGDLPPAAKAKVAGGNLVRLLRGQQPPRLISNAHEDELMAAVRQGRPLPVKFIDVHMHILHEGMNGAGGSYRMERGGPSGVLALLKRMGCGGGGFMSWSGTVSGDAVDGNECVRQALDHAPRGFWGLATFDPSHYSREEIAHQLVETYADPRFVGMKPYTVYGIPYDDPVYDQWWQFGSERGYYALLHRTRGDFREVDVLAGKYPNVRWLVAHCGSDYGTADGVIEMCRKHPNVYAEITLTPVTFGIIDYLAARAGADRVVYGSDLPMRDPRQQLGWVVFSRLPVAAKRQILRENALKVLAPCWRQLPPANRPVTTRPRK